MCSHVYEKNKREKDSNGRLNGYSLTSAHGSAKKIDRQNRAGESIIVFWGFVYRVRFLGLRVFFTYDGLKK